MPLELLSEKEWLERRKVSASRIASLFTDRQGELTLWAILTGKEEEEFPELLGDFGRATERVSRKWFARCAQDVEPAAIWPGPSLGWELLERIPLVSSTGPLTASPDTLLDYPVDTRPEPSLAESFAEHKTCDRIVSWKWAGGPDQYAWIQVQSTFAAADEAGINWDGAYATVLIGNGYNEDRDFQVFDVERDEDFIGEIKEWAWGFWTKHVQADKPPRPDGLERTRETLRLLFPPRLKGDDRNLGVLPQDPFASYYRRMKRVEGLIDKLGRERDRLKQEIEFAMGEAGLDEAAIAASTAMPNPPRFARLAYERKGYTVKPTTVKQFKELK